MLGVRGDRPEEMIMMLCSIRRFKYWLQKIARSERVTTTIRLTFSKAKRAVACYSV